MRALLDTHVFVALARQGVEGVGPRSRKLIGDEETDLLLSSASIAEIAVKASIKKLVMTALDVSKAAEDLRLTLVPFEPRHAVHLFDLPLHHRDPFDRMLIATALSEGVPIISQDSEFRKYRGLRVIW
ncbi:MAG: type II toxin-antitoxin system VapC family toxin [Bryobacteraceae bacterium]